MRIHRRLDISHHSPALNDVGMRLGIWECPLVEVSRVAPRSNAHGVRTPKRFDSLYRPALNEVGMGEAARLKECNLTVRVSRVSPSSAYGVRIQSCIMVSRVSP